jgi:hypothetical protein
MAPDINEQEVEWIKHYAGDVARTFGGDFENAGDRFKQAEQLLQRFTSSVDILLSKGRSYISGVDEAHNELCVAAQLLVNKAPELTLEYEPVLEGCSRSIDFRAVADTGETFYVDVKTIKPKPKDRWKQFEQAQAKGWFPDNVNIVLSEEWLGGELWHNLFTARSRMLEYTRELETKISEGKLASETSLFILVLCGEGFHWHQDALEDFVAFYRSGAYRPDDPFSKAETHYMAQETISLDRTVTRFACLSRPQFEVRHRRLNWNVQPPKGPVF